MEMNKHKALARIEQLEFELKQSINDKKYLDGEYGRLKVAYKQSETLVSSLRIEYSKLEMEFKKSGKTNKSQLIKSFYIWLDGLSEQEHHEMSLTEKCEKFLLIYKKY